MIDKKKKNRNDSMGRVINEMETISCMLWLPQGMTVRSKNSLEEESDARMQCNIINRGIQIESKN